jgi:hypothetical protein
MSDDLKKRLLDWEMWDEGDINDTREEAHAYIEELEAEVGRLETQCKGLAQSAMNNGQALIIAEDKLAKFEAMNMQDFANYLTCKSIATFATLKGTTNE